MKTQTIAQVFVGVMLIGSICVFVFQQRLATKLLRNGVRWPRREIAGNLRKPLDGHLWLIYLFSLRWRSMPDKALRNQCLIWTVFMFVLYALAIPLMVMLIARSWSHVPLTR